MNNVITLTKRNLRLFLRDRATVFFSFLSTLVLVTLYFLFIAKIYTAGMDDPAAGGIAMPLTSNAKYFIVYVQMMAGVLVLNSMSLATGAFSTIANDYENKRLDSLSLTPARPFQIILSYFITGLTASFLINVFTWVVSFCIIGFSTGYWISAGAFIMVLAVLLAASLISCALMMLITSLVKSPAAIGVFNGIAGTFFGFLCGIYMPYSNLGDATKTIGSVLPFSHLTIWLKRVVLGDAFSQLGITGEFKELLYSEYFSASSIGFCGLSVPLPVMVGAAAVFGIVCLVVSCRLLNKRINHTG